MKGKIMLKNTLIICSILISILLSACGTKDERPIPEGYTRGVVIKTMNSGGYSYMLLDQDGKEEWIAATQMEVKKDDTVYYQIAMEMKDFHSNTMNKDFKKIIFSSECTKNPWKDLPAGSDMKGMKGDNPHKKLKTSRDEELIIQPFQGGYTVEQLYKQKSSLSGKTVKIRGKVVKFSPDIMGKNWVHIQDGTGSKNDYDLTVTTMETMNVGNIVVFEGVLAVDKDFGSGYKFSVIIENASIIKEPSGI